MDMTALLQELEAKRQNAWHSTIFCTLMGIAPVALLLFRKPAVALVVLALILAYYFFLVRPDLKKFQDSFLRANLLASLSPVMEEVTYQGKAGIPREELFASRLLPIREESSCMTFHRLTGRSHGLEVELSDATFQLETPDEKGRPRFLSGCWARVKLYRPAGGKARLVTADLLAPDALTPWYKEKLGLAPCSLEPHRAARVFTAWQEPHDSRLAQSVLGHLMDLREKKGLPLALALEGDRLAAFFPRRFLAPGALSCRQPVTQGMLLASPLPELEELLKTALACARAADPESVEKDR